MNCVGVPLQLYTMPCLCIAQLHFVPKVTDRLRQLDPSTTEIMTFVLSEQMVSGHSTIMGAGHHAADQPNST